MAKKIANNVEHKNKTQTKGSHELASQHPSRDSGKTGLRQGRKCVEQVEDLYLL